MALTTQCPHCKTTFRVAADQLKLREGMVRCGSCNTVFDGNAALLDTPAPGAMIGQAATNNSQPVLLTKHAHTVWREPSQRPSLEAGKLPPAPQDLHFLGPEPDTAAPEESTNTTLSDDFSAEPSFMRQGRRRARSGKLLRWLMGIGSLFLLLTLLVQGLFTFRNELAVQVPPLAPTLHAACALLRCQIDLPIHIEQLSVEQGELQAVAENTYSYATVLHNQSRGAQAWPALELILNDSADQPVLRRVFTPAEYLPAPDKVSRGMPGHSEQAIKLYFDLTATKAAGYHIAIFYP